MAQATTCCICVGLLNWSGDLVVVDNAILTSRLVSQVGRHQQRLESVCYCHSIGSSRKLKPMSCSLCPSTHIIPAGKEGNSGSANCWFGEEGLYHWQPQSVRPQKPDDPTWVFGLEDQFFPLSPPEAAEPAEPSSAVDGLTEEFLQFLEKRLADVNIKKGKEEEDKADDDDDGSSGGVVDIFPSHPPDDPFPLTSMEAAKPIPPVRRRRLQRSMSLQVVKAAPAPLLSSAAEFPEVLHHVNPTSVQEFRKPSISRGGSIASDLLQRVKRWAAATSTFRRAFRKASPHRPQQPIDTRFYTNTQTKTLAVYPIE